MTYTTDQLIEMADETFHKAVTNNMIEASRGSSAFQHESVIERTMSALVEWLWITNNRIDDRAEDPDCPRELYEKTLKYRSHLLSVIDVTERRIAWSKGMNYRVTQKWKDTLHAVVDAILEGKPDLDILAMKIPAFRQGEDVLDLESWWEVRLQKEPARVKPWLELERNREAA